jgi:3-hydroxyisobutyrate dehydrogenase-like beta-hydroxyacid dehydrogenase
MTKVTVLGLGAMGSRMAANLYPREVPDVADGLESEVGKRSEQIEDVVHGQ